MVIRKDSYVPFAQYYLSLVINDYNNRVGSIYKINSGENAIHDSRAIRKSTCTDQCPNSSSKGTLYFGIEIS